MRLIKQAGRIQRASEKQIRAALMFLTIEKKKKKEKKKKITKSYSRARLVAFFLIFLYFLPDPPSRSFNNVSRRRGKRVVYATISATAIPPCARLGGGKVIGRRDDMFRITASFVKGLGRCQNQSRVHLTPSATSTIRESRTYAN